ncbi:MAG: hypothetical protein ACYTF6_02750 [Planctomycetota bacterium]
MLETAPPVATTAGPTSRSPPGVSIESNPRRSELMAGMMSRQICPATTICAVLFRKMTPAVMYLAIRSGPAAARTYHPPAGGYVQAG